MTTVPASRSPLEGEVAAEAVDERQGQARHERQRPEEHLHRHRRAHADVADPRRRGDRTRRPPRRAARTASRAWRRGPRTAPSSATSSPRCASAASRSSAPTRAPTRRAGITNSGSSTSASSVICHDRPSITTSVSTSAMTLVTTPASADVNARWAPITSLFSRLTRAPVWVRVKNAIGIRCTCSNTWRRRSRMRSSPRRDDCSRSSRPTPASSDRHAGDEHGDRDDDLPARRRRRSRRRPAGEHGREHAEHRPTRWPAAGRRRSCARWGRANSATRRSVARWTRRRSPLVLHGALQRHPHVEVAHGGGP